MEGYFASVNVKNQLWPYPEHACSSQILNSRIDDLVLAQGSQQRKFFPCTSSRQSNCAWHKYRESVSYAEETASAVHCSTPLVSCATSQLVRHFAAWSIHNLLFSFLLTARPTSARQHFFGLGSA